MPVADLPDKVMEQHGDLIFKSGFRGVFYDGCIERKEGSSFRRKAHAHTKGAYAGWICFRSIKRVYSSILQHELAHIITRQGHTRKFYECVRSIGGRIDRNDRRVAPLATRGL